MRFDYSNEVVHLVNIRHVTSKNGKDLYFANVTDITSYENDTFMINKAECSPDKLVAGENYRLELEVENGYSSAILIPISDL